MRQSRQTRAFERIAASSAAGETPILATRAIVGKFSSGRFAALASNSGGLVGSMIAKNKPQYVVLTNRRLVFLEQTMFGGPAKKITGEIPVGQFSLAEYKPGGMPLVRIAFAAEGDGVALTFGALFKSDANGLVAALNSVAA